MTEEIKFTAEEFADYWESHQEDAELGENFMVKKLGDTDGQTLLARTATVLAQRHGVSSSKVITFRQTMRRACKKAGIETLTPKKVKGTGTKDSPDPIMVLDKSKAHDKPAKSGFDIAYGRMEKWVKSGEISVTDLYNAALDLNVKYM